MMVGVRVANRSVKYGFVPYLSEKRTCSVLKSFLRIIETLRKTMKIRLCDFV